MASYAFWMAQSARWDRCVDFGSPMSAWTAAMRAEYKAAQSEGRRPSMANIPKKNS